ncbi:DUF6308 family protein [Streptomyces sp. NPDC056661]
MPSSPTRAPSRTCAATSAWTDLQGPLRSREPDSKAVGGSGDHPAVANAVTASDLIAVQTLSVTVPTAAALDLLEGHTGTQLSTLLRAIPRDVDMADATEADLAPGSPAHKAWHLLRDQPGIGSEFACDARRNQGCNRSVRRGEPAGRVGAERASC